MRNWLRSLIWIALGLALGVGLGLYLGWVAWPTEFTDASPSILHERHRREYTLMIAHAYVLDGDLDAARRRLHALDPEAPDNWLLSLTVDAILSGRDEATEIHPLVTLAYDLGLESPAMAPYLDEATAEDVSE